MAAKKKAAKKKGTKKKGTKKKAGSRKKRQFVALLSSESKSSSVMPELLLLWRKLIFKNNLLRYGPVP